MKKMLLDTPSPMNNAINDQIALNLADIHLDNTLKISYNLLLCFANVWKFDNSKIAKIWLA